MGKKRGGSTKATAEHMRARFVEAYCANGWNGKQAAITAGYSARTAESQASRLLRGAKVAAAVAVRRAQVLAQAEAETGVSIARTLREVARVAYFDPGALFDESGRLLAVKDLPAEVRAGVAKVKVKRLKGAMKVDLSGEGAPLEHVPEELVEVSIWDKNSALDKAMRHLGLYEADNKQKPAPTVAVGILTVARPDEEHFRKLRRRVLALK